MIRDSTVSVIMKHCFTHRAGDVFKSDGVADLLPKLDPHFFTDPLRDRHCGHTSRLGASDHTVLGVPILMEVLQQWKGWYGESVETRRTHLSQLRGLSGPGFPNHHHDVVLPDDVEQLKQLRDHVMLIT